MWLKTAPSSEEVEQLERPENAERLTEISCNRWNRKGHPPVREEVRGSVAWAVDEIAAFQIACRKGGGGADVPLLFFVSGQGPRPECWRSRTVESQWIIERQSYSSKGNTLK